MNNVGLRDAIPAARTSAPASMLLNESGEAFAEASAGAPRSVAADERGQGLAEYGLILGLIAILCIAAVMFFSGNLQGLLSNAGSSI
jgi:pilus assembly protein Flp/PilA